MADWAPILDEDKPYLDGRWGEGCTNAWKLWEETVAPFHRQRASPATARPPRVAV
ncbi:hypothetical protein [Streptomyces albidocamelliae]|uniref:Uncharacterized protein n=1 Tax=Streptomyces albidocamelliae TaxID=2981135 RepID=A0ABY6F170_9ACTN|nr:hypothetical protein [Streptomyces sp. HUAS 14-6]UXY40383.1 hypothetical protein N8I86_38095 [Streptomyces sp. HUAS 14-6]